MYVLGNPIRYNDPTGHRNCEEDGYDCPGDTITKIITAPANPHSDWNSGRYSGCFMCHAAVANGRIELTNSQLAASYNNAVNFQAKEGALLLASGGAGVVVGLSLPVAGAATTACALDAECAKIADNAFVKVDRSSADSSMTELGLRTSYSGGRIWLTQYQYVKEISDPEEFETILYKQSLWSETAGKFSDGATMRLVNIGNATPAGVTNMVNGIPQWFTTSDVPPELLQVIKSINP